MSICCESAGPVQSEPAGREEWLTALPADRRPTGPSQTSQVLPGPISSFMTSQLFHFDPPVPIAGLCASVCHCSIE